MKKNFILMIVVLISVLLNADLDFGKSLFEDRLYDEAIGEFEKIIARSPTSDQAQQAMFLIGEAYREKKQFSQAEASYKRLLEGYPSLLFRDKVLYYLASVQLKQKRYEKAIKNFEILLENYPLTDYAKDAIVLYLQSIYGSGDYMRTIKKSDELILAYPGHYDLPEFYLWQAKAFFANRMPEDGLRVLENVIENYPEHDVRWEAISLQAELLEKRSGKEQAAEFLRQQMQQTEIPRLFEKKLRYELAKLYEEIKNYQAAYEQLDMLTNKFNNAAELDEYLLDLTRMQIKLSKFTEIVNGYDDYKKVFKNSDLLAQYELFYAEAIYKQNDLEKARTVIANVITYSEDKKIHFKANFLISRILQSEGKFVLAIEELEKLLTYESESKAEILYSIGNIYFEKFENYQNALKYYRMILTGYSNKAIQQKAIYRIALCYEIMEEYEKAMQQLEQINLETVSELDFRKKISLKKDYLKKFKIKKYDDAFEKLLTAIYSYFEDDDKRSFQDRIIDIYTEDLKEFEKSLEIIGDAGEPGKKYQRALIYLKLAERAKAEAKMDRAEQFIILAEQVASNLSRTEFPRWKKELEIRKKIINSRKLEQELITEMEQFISQYNDASATNQFLLLVANYYLQREDRDKAFNLIDKLQLDDAINDEDFYEAKIALAEYYYEQDKDLQALGNYELAEEYIDINKPVVYFHYAVVLNETGHKQKAHNMLSFLLQNAERFEYYNRAIEYFTDLLISEQDHHKALKFMQFKPETARDNAFYEKMADSFLQIGNQEMAKEALTKIVDKNETILRKLAELQYKTGDLAKARASYLQLLEKSENNLFYYERLANIAMQQEKYLEAAQNFKKIVDELGENFEDYENIAMIAKNNIIALYRIENRPKAERLTKEFKKVLTEEMRAEIRLNEGIYYSKVDKDKAAAIFSKMIKDDETPPALMVKAYFWRGLVYMQQEELALAKDDFLTVSRSIDEELRNQADLKLGTINFSQENYQDALFHYSKVIENDENGELAFDAARNFAFVCKTMKEWQKAIAAYELILQRWGDRELEAETLFDIAFCHFRDKKYGKAIEMFERTIPLLEDETQKAEAQYWIGESYYGLEDYEKAAAELLKVRYSYGDITQWAASAELRVGEAYMAMTKPERARTTYERVIERYGKFSQWGEEATKRLQALRR